MGFGAKVLSSLMLATVCIGAVIAIANAEALSENNPDQSTQYALGQEIRTLSERVAKLNKQLAEADSRSAKAEASIADIVKKTSELKDSIGDNKKMSFDANATLLNILIALTALVITGMGVAFAILAFFGVKGFGEVKKEIKEQLTSTSDKLESDINSRLSSRYKETVEEYFQGQDSKIREEFSSRLHELEEKIDECCGRVAAPSQASYTPPVGQQKTSGNVFDDVKP